MRLLLAIASLVFATQAFAAGEVYKWTDEKGVVHYTDAPPEDRDFERRKSVAAPAPAAGDESSANDPAESEADDKPAAGSAAANCQAARLNMENIERFEKITMDRDGDGKPEVLTPEEREQELKRNQALVSIYCAQEGAAQ